MNADPGSRRPRAGTVTSSGSLCDGPFGPAELVDRVRVDDIAAAYRRKCGADVAPWFDGLDELDLFECRITGYRFWRPAAVAGDADFYAAVSARWADYYRPERWEYPIARRLLKSGDRVLEVGSGRGYFLKSIETRVDEAWGLELNGEAIANRVTACDILAMTVEEVAEAHPREFDAVCSFQVLEHVVNPAAFLRACRACLQPGGLLILSTPNHDSAMLANREDAFDMPPHHMGHFSPAVYANLAVLLDMPIVDLQVERRFFVPADSVTPRTRGRLTYRLARKISTLAMGMAYRLCREPGNNLLVALRKPRTP